MSVETFHTRGTRGDRIDVLTIWDTVNLSPVAECYYRAESDLWACRSG